MRNRDKTAKQSAMSSLKRHESVEGKKPLKLLIGIPFKYAIGGYSDIYEEHTRSLLVACVGRGRGRG